MSTMPLNLNDGHDLSVSMIPQCFNDCTLRPFTSLQCRHSMRRPANAPSSALPLPHQHLPLLAGAHFCLLLLRPGFQHLPLARLHTASGVWQLQPQSLQVLGLHHQLNDAILVQACLHDVNPALLHRHASFCYPKPQRLGQTACLSWHQDPRHHNLRVLTLRHAP